MSGEPMKKLKLLCLFLLVLTSCHLMIPTVAAAPAFAADLTAYTKVNAVTAKAADELQAYVKTEQAFSRSLTSLSRTYPVLVRRYRAALDDLNDATKRIVRDQDASDRLLASVVKLASQKHTNAAWVLLKHSAVGQKRFLDTIGRAQLLMERCMLLHAQLARLKA